MHTPDHGDQLSALAPIILPSIFLIVLGAFL